MTKVNKKDSISSKIYTIRGIQVMLDSDLAVLYECLNGTKTINLAVKRNIERFPEDFYFQLTEDELRNLRSLSGTSNEKDMWFQAETTSERESTMRSKIGTASNFKHKKLSRSQSGTLNKNEETMRFQFGTTSEFNKEEQSSRSQFVTLNDAEKVSRFQFETLNKSGDKRGYNIKYLPYAFTEQGIAMLSSVLRTKVASEVSVNIMRTFVEMRKFISSNAQVFERLTNVEYKLLEHDKSFDELFDLL